MHNNSEASPKFLEGPNILS